MTEEKTIRIHFPVLSILGVVFVTLKLCGVIDWSWWLVTLPFWLWIALLIVAAGILLLFAGFVSLLEYLQNK